jgi:uncharacterized membrane protein YkvA (DUF1232 family)
VTEPRKVLPSRDEGFFKGIADHVKLVWRLMGDSRVSPVLKIIPFGSLVYFLLPLDIPGPIDDLAVVWVGTCLFIELCPPEVVDEHRAAVGREVPASWRDVEKSDPDSEEIIDADYKEI